MADGFQDGPLRVLVLERLSQALGVAATAIGEVKENNVDPDSLIRDSKVFLKNESHLHNVPENSELHFVCTIATDVFRYTPYHQRLQRHRFVHDAVGRDLLFEMDGKAPRIHMLTINAWTLDEWRERGGEVESSPPCISKR